MYWFRINSMIVSPRKFQSITNSNNSNYIPLVLNFESNAIDYQQSFKLVGIDTIVTGGSRAAATSKMERCVIIFNSWKPSYLHFDTHIHFVPESIK